MSFSLNKVLHILQRAYLHKQTKKIKTATTKGHEWRIHSLKKQNNETKLVDSAVKDQNLLWNQNKYGGVVLTTNLYKIPQ